MLKHPIYPLAPPPTLTWACEDASDPILIENNATHFGPTALFFNQTSIAIIIAAL